MKKIIIAFMLFFFCNAFAQMKINDSIIVPIKESAGVKIFGVYKLGRVMNEKKMYITSVYYQNTNNENIIVKTNSEKKYFAKTSLKGSSGYDFELREQQISNNTFLIAPKKIYAAKTYYFKWYNGNDIPEFTSIDIEFEKPVTETITNVTIPAGTLIKAMLTKNINGQDLAIGDKLDFVLAQDIIIDEKIAIPSFSKITGTVTDAKGSRMLGKKGKLAFTIDFLYYKSNVVKLQSQFAKNIQGSGVVVAGASILLTPFALFINGKNAKYEKGTTFDCYVSEDTFLK